MRRKLFFRKIAVLATIGMFAGCGGNGQEPKPDEPTPEPSGDETLFPANEGEPLPAWTPGTLDIHTLSTGRGECSFFILPDGTSMIIDAAGSLITYDVVAKDPDVSADPLPPRPSVNISSAKAIADYVTHFNPNGKSVDYWLCSHYDTDHMGNFPETYASICPVSAAIGKHPEGGFYLNGINELGTLLDFKKIIDRDYTFPVDRSEEKRFKDYIRFLNWTRTAKGTVYETAEAGHADQLRLNYSPTEFLDFSIRILCASGYYWTSSGQTARFNLPVNTDGTPDLKAINMVSPKENIYSVAIMLKWGSFDMFSGGDLQYNNRGVAPWLDSEAPLCGVVGNVEVMKANHHGNNNANSAELLDRLRPQTLLINTWRDGQPKPGAIKDIVTASPYINIFATGASEAQREKLKSYADRFKSWEGHVVVRVASDGQYKIFVVDATDQNYKVRSIHGAYRSRQ